MNHRPRSRTPRPATLLRQRGSTFVEYAMLMGLFAAAATGGIKVVNAETGAKVKTVSETIGSLPDVQGSIPESTVLGGVTTPPPAPTTTAAPTTTSSSTSTSTSTSSTTTTVAPTTTAKPTTTTTSTTTTVAPTTTSTSTTTTAGAPSPYDAPTMKTNAYWPNPDWYGWTADVTFTTEYPKGTVITVKATAMWSGQWPGDSTTLTCTVANNGKCSVSFTGWWLGASDRLQVDMVSAKVGGATYTNGLPAKSVKPPAN